MVGACNADYLLNFLKKYCEYPLLEVDNQLVSALLKH